MRPALDGVALQRRDNLVGSGQYFLSLFLPVPGDSAKHRDKTRPAGPVLGREIGAAKKRLARGRQPDAHRPAAMPGGLLHIGHVDPVQIGPLFAVHFHRHKISVQQFRHRRVFERLVGHHMTPVTGRVADAKENRLLFRLRLGERFRAPWEPFHRVVRVLAQIRRLFGGKAVGHETESHPTE